LALTARVSGASAEDVFDPKVPPQLQKVTYQTKDGRIKTVTKAELQDQMEASEKLMQSLNETWEQKLERTQEVQKEREKALEELGITVEKNLVGVHTPKKVRDTLLHSKLYRKNANLRIRCPTSLIW
jgi:kinesin family protein 1